MKIVFNGREYSSVDAMPEAERRQYLEVVANLGDADRDGIPDIAEKPGTQSMNVTVKQTVTYNGQRVDDPSKLPPEVRAMLEKAEQQPGAQTTTRTVIQHDSPDENFPTSFHETTGGGPSFGRILLVVVVLAVVAMAILWFTGIRPQDLLGR